LDFIFAEDKSRIARIASGGWMAARIRMAITLEEIGNDPADYRRVLERMTYVGMAAVNITRSETKTHPSLDARVTLNQWLCGQVGQAPPQRVEEN
jgi:hypothetical protein